MAEHEMPSSEQAEARSAAVGTPASTWLAVLSRAAACSALLRCREPEKENYVMTFLSSMNFLRKSDFRHAVLSGAPVILFDPSNQFPAINGHALVAGPWPHTAPPVEELTTYHGGRKIIKQRERVIPWHADVVVNEMRIVGVR